jgi:hypothetical protein
MVMYRINLTYRVAGLIKADKNHLPDYIGRHNFLSLE